jgi:Glycosyl hydrolase family 65, C-terminal domain
LRFAVRFRGQRLCVGITPGKVTYAVDGDRAVPVAHCSRDKIDDFEVRPGKTVTRKWSPVRPRTPRPSQPVGREPRGLH